MYFLLSPAKSLNENDGIPLNVGNHYASPALLDQSSELMQILKQKTQADLEKLMSISAELAKLNVERNQNWHTPFDANNAKPAIYLFDGDVYTGLDAYHLNKDAILYLNERLGILSGLYGLLKPLDLIQPYRLEMGTKLKNAHGEDLYQFWGSQLSQLINERMTTLNKKAENKAVINLASNEYFKAIDKKSLKSPIITPRFEDEKNGKYKVISFYAKKARGLMVKFAAENQLTDSEQLKQFNLEGYQYCESASNEKTWVFRRREA